MKRKGDREGGTERRREAEKERSEWEEERDTCRGTQEIKRWGERDE